MPYYQGCICQISLGGVEVLAIEVDDRATVLMHRYIESRPPLRFFNSSRGVRNFRGGFNPQPPVKYSPAYYARPSSEFLRFTKKKILSRKIETVDVCLEMFGCLQRTIAIRKCKF